MIDDFDGKRIAARQLLDDLLASLVSYWGLDVVRNRLAKIADQEHPTEPPKRPQRTARTKPSARALVRRSHAPADKQQQLMELAQAFDEKHFLPTIGDAREFMAMRGRGHASLPPNRTDAFKLVLRELIEMSRTELQRLVQQESHFGPVSLRPISDAISDAGKARRAADDEDGSSPSDEEAGQASQQRQRE